MSKTNQVFYLQYVATICASVGSMYMGTTLGFSGPVGPLLTNENATIHLSDEQVGWFSSCVTIGAVGGSMASGTLMGAFGRRGAIMMIGIPGLSGWILIIFAQNYMMLIIARLIHGLGSGMALAIIPAYIGEISAPKIRGKLGSMFVILMVAGLLYNSIVGALVKDMRWISIICIPIVIFFVVTMYFLPESPMYLMGKNRKKEAEEALKKLNGEDCDISFELELLVTMTNESEEGNKFSSKLSMLKSPSGYKPLFIMLMLYNFMQWTGVNAILFNLNSIFLSSGSTISADLSSIIFMSLFLSGTIIGGLLIDRLGRRPLMLLSTSGITISLGFLGLYLYLKQLSSEWEIWVLDYLFWLPLLSLGVYGLLFCVGVNTVSFVLAGELFNPEVAEISASISAAFVWGMAFVVTYSFLPLKNLLQDHGAYWLYAVCCIAATLYNYFYLPETKGKTSEEIDQMFSNRPSTRENLDRNRV